MVYRQRQKRLSWSGVSSLTWSPDDKTLAIGSGLSIAHTKRLSLPKMTNECTSTSYARVVWDCYRSEARALPRPARSKNERTQLILHSLTPFLLARPGSLWPLTFCTTSVLPNCSALQTNPVHTQRQATFETRHRLILGVPEVGYLLLW